MSTGILNLLLPDDLEERLNAEAQRECIPHSEAARLAITQFLLRNERKRFLATLVAEARAAYINPAVRAEALTIGE